MKNALISTRSTLILSLFILLALGLSGCAGLGQVVSVDRQVRFNDKGNSQGTFKSGQLTVDYSYRLAGENMILAGDVNYPESVDSLTVRVLFLDQSGAILQQKIVYYSGYRVFKPWATDRTFRENMVVPAGAGGISFSYSVQPRSSHK